MRVRCFIKEDSPTIISHFTILEINTVIAFIWHEGQSKRGSSEIATAVDKALEHYDKMGKKEALLYMLMGVLGKIKTPLCQQCSYISSARQPI